MDIPVNAEVQCVDGACGRSTYVIIDQRDQQVTHVVVEERVFPRSERVVPLDLIRESTPQVIKLRCTQEELAALPSFTELQYQSGTDAWENYAPGQWLFAPGALPAQAAVPLQVQNVPAGDVALHRGARVEATDGEVGSVAELIVDPVTSQLTHLVLQQGSLFSQRRVTIDASDIDHVADEVIHLKIDRHAVEQLPERNVR